MDLFDRTWLEFAPESDGVDVVLRVKDAAPNRAAVGLGFTEWERARGSIRLRNQNTLGFGEQVELLVAGSDAERVIEASPYFSSISAGARARARGSIPV